MRWKKTATPGKCLKLAISYSYIHSGKQLFFYYDGKWAGRNVTTGWGWVGISLMLLLHMRGRRENVVFEVSSVSRVRYTIHLHFLDVHSNFCSGLECYL